MQEGALTRVSPLTQPRVPSGTRDGFLIFTNLQITAGPCLSGDARLLFYQNCNEAAVYDCDFSPARGSPGAFIRQARSSGCIKNVLSGFKSGKDVFAIGP